jgi:hypothetical protein
MIRNIAFSILMFLSITASAGIYQNTPDTSKPVYNILYSSKNNRVDSNILIVVNGSICGTIREVKRDVATLFHQDSIESIIVLKDMVAVSKYGKRGRAGVIEFQLKGLKFEAVAITDPKEPIAGSSDNNRIFEKVEIQAAFQGGEYIWRKYLAKNLNALVPGNNNAPSGIYTIIVQFVVDTIGNISGVTALTNHGYGMEEEVIRVIMKGPKWLPAIHRGQLVRAYRKQPVTFVLEGIVDIQTKEKYILYSGVNNPITISVHKIKDEDLEVSLSSGTITRISEGSYEAKMDKPGTAILTIWNKKENKEVEKVAFTVK